ncbi:MAG TPA: hypothetical protein VFG20_18390 [Planctomycetaceae bacterium]|nr:hypothetical protein [Planctomycetaceae bacterium]
MDEPLTPEILEDEAIRGDVVLRWVVVALALLLGCSQLSDALPLVHARAGEWLAGNGFIPSGKDPFSLTTADRRWIQLDWLFDLLAAAVNSLGGGIGLSLAGGAVAAATFALVVQSHRRDIRTWWTAVCAALALIASYSRFDFGPPEWTLLGVAAVLMILVTAENTNRWSILWALVPVVWIWSQLSSQAWIGPAMILLYWAGSAIDPPRIADQPRLAAPSQVMMFPAIASLLVMLIHPFTWHTWEAAWTQYTVDYPMFRMLYPRPVVMDLVWYPLWSPLVWEMWTHRLAAGLVLAVVAGACLLLNRQRVSWAHALLYLGGNALGISALNDLPLASIINAVLAGIHAQEWYRNRFGQIYSVAWAEVAFSRGGRAVTLLAFFALAWAIISGRLDGPDGRRTGVGLSRNLQVELQTYGSLPAVTQNERGFHTTVRQGDFLIAAGRKSVVDRRVRLFSGEGDQNLLEWYESARRGFSPAANQAEFNEHQALQQEAMERFELSHVVLRLSQPRDDAALSTLLSANDWSLTELLPTVAVLHWVNPADSARQQFIAQSEFNPLNAGFRPESPAIEEAPPRPLLPAWSQQLISTPQHQRTAETIRAEHYLHLGRMARRAPWPFQAGCYHLAIRAARAGVREDSLQAEPYLILGKAYAGLAQLEAMALAEHNVPWNRSLRYYTAVAALREAVRLRPDLVEAWGQLFDLHQQTGFVDAALTDVREILKATPVADDADDAAHRQREALLDLEINLENAVAKVRNDLQQAGEGQADFIRRALYAHDNGCVELAVQLLRDDAIELERNPFARQMITLWLAELGEGDALDDSARRLEAVSGQLPLWTWRTPVAFAAVGRGDYDTAVKLWGEIPPAINQITLQSLLESSAISTVAPFVANRVPFPMVHLEAAQQSLEQWTRHSFDASFYAGCCEMERGNTSAATAAFRSAVQQIPDASIRPLLRLYLFCLTDELIDVEPPADWIPQPSDLFAPESTTK